MPPPNPQPKPPAGDYKTIAAEYAAAKRVKEAEDADAGHQDILRQQAAASAAERQREALEKRRRGSFDRRWMWAIAFWICMLCIHIVGIAYFTSGFLLSRLVLEDKSACDAAPLGSEDRLLNWPGRGTVEGGCWHPKVFDRAVIVLIDALRYDFTVPVNDDAYYHNALSILHETAKNNPKHAFLRPFIADPPTATLQRLKGLTTGTLPTFIDLGSNFGGTAIEEDNLLMQLRDNGKKIVHLGDDTWTALFPGYFEPNISRAYDSFNVWDLHTVDNGVLEHIFPLMNQPKGQWDVLIGHCLGVDHAGHRYGPDHPAMKEKLQQMDTFVRKLANTIDDDTLLIVMGDHGMDSKGDHGGESDDEVEAALWMYSSRPIFGRTNPEFAEPPRDAKTRPVNQIDLVPTLALLLGIPIPFNNLGWPIEEVFVGEYGDDWASMVGAAQTTAAGIKRYQDSYFAARGLAYNSTPPNSSGIRDMAQAGLPEFFLVEALVDLYKLYTEYQVGTLRTCKDLWARFDIPNMVLGIIIMALSLVALLVYASRDDDDDAAVLDDIELDMAERELELEDVQADAGAGSVEALHRDPVKAAIAVGAPTFAIGFALSVFAPTVPWHRSAGAAALTGTLALIGSMLGAGKRLQQLLPTNIWGWLGVLFAVSQSVGFASNSYTIWEDSILLFFLGTFGLVAALTSLSLPSKRDRTLAVYHSVLFVILGRLASFSKLCREEQMPYCKSTYYASANSSTSAPWQLLIPFVVFIVLPTIIKAYYTPTRSYEGLAPTWVGYVLRTGLFMTAAYWTLDAADNGNWIPGIPEGTFKTFSIYLAQLALGLAVIAGSTAFAWAPPCVSIFTTASPNDSTRAQITVLGYANAHGARYLLLPLNLLAATTLLSKPMGAGALAVMAWQVLALVELLDLNALAAQPIGPIILAMLANFYYFKTGHQAALSSIQWDAAFIALRSVRYPWSPLLVTANTFPGHVLAAAAVPLVALWKAGPRRKGLLETVARGLAVFVAYFAVQSLATMAWAGWLRRHLMLYRIFSPRFMLGAVALLLVDILGIVVALTGYRANTLAVAEVFGWAE
jgi:GPI ethanolamine phosphate transferase 3 subunit O